MCKTGVLRHGEMCNGAPDDVPAQCQFWAGVVCDTSSLRLERMCLNIDGMCTVAGVGRGWQREDSWIRVNRPAVEYTLGHPVPRLTGPGVCTHSTADLGRAWERREAVPEWTQHDEWRARQHRAAVPACGPGCAVTWRCVGTVVRMCAGLTALKVLDVGGVHRTGCHGLGSTVQQPVCGWMVTVPHGDARRRSVC